MTQAEIEALTIQIERQFSELEIRIMSDIIRLIEENGFSTASSDWQMTRLQQLGRSEEEIKRWIQEVLEVTDDELEHIFSDDVYREYYGYDRAYKINGLEQIPLEENVQMQSLISEVKEQTDQTFRNMTGSMGFAIRDPVTGEITYSPLREFYTETLDHAIMDIQTGAFSYQTVLDRTINVMVNSGVRWVDYESGHRNRVEVAARRAVLTGFRQIQGKINERVAADLGTDTYEVTYHVGARPSHQPWQGRVWTMQQLQEICGLGTVTGLHGANCYHDYNAFIPGYSVRTYTDEQLEEMLKEENAPKEYNGKEYTTYEALQQQRKMERTMRAQRQKIKLMEEGGADQDKITIARAKYQGQMGAYKDFSKKMKLPEQMDRVYMDGLGDKIRKQTEKQKMASARGVAEQKMRIAAVKEAKDWIARKSESDIMNLSDAEMYALNRYVSSESYLLNDKLRRGEKLTAEEQSFVLNLNAALDKMPEYVGTVYRSLSDFGIDDVDEFISTYTVGECISFPSYISTSKNIYDEGFPIQYEICSKHGKDIRTMNEAEKEILFKQGSNFRVTKIEGHTIYLEEI